LRGIREKDKIEKLEIRNSLTLLEKITHITGRPFGTEQTTILFANFGELKIHQSTKLGTVIQNYYPNSDSENLKKLSSHLSSSTFAMFSTILKQTPVKATPHGFFCQIPLFVFCKNIQHSPLELAGKPAMVSRDSPIFSPGFSTSVLHAKKSLRKRKREDQPKKSNATLFASVMCHSSLKDNLSGTSRAYLLNMNSRFAGMNLQCCFSHNTVLPFSKSKD